MMMSYNYIALIIASDEKSGQAKIWVKLMNSEFWIFFDTLF